jgi:hypothetical protein
MNVSHKSHFLYIRYVKLNPYEKLFLLYKLIGKEVGYVLLSP